MQTVKTLVPLTKRAAKVLRAINNKTRQTLIDYLIQHPGATVTQIYRDLGWEQSVTSQHLAVLRHEGMVKTEREGKHIRYRIDKMRLAEVELIANQLCEA